MAIKKIIYAVADLDIGLFIPAAAIENNGYFVDQSVERELALIQLNITSVYILTHYFEQYFVKKGRGGILLVASLSGLMPSPYFANYGGSKAYIVTLATSLYAELKSKGIDISVLAPGVTDTPMADNTGVDWSKTPMTKMSPAVVAKIALDHLGRKPVIVPGMKNKIMIWMMNHLMSFKSAAHMAEKMMRNALGLK